MTSFLDLSASTENAPGCDPTVDVPSVISDLKTRSLNRLDDVEVFSSPDFAEYNVAYFDGCGIDWLDGAKLPGFNFARHGVATRSKRNRFTIL
jgi:hypothetical protein